MSPLLALIISAASPTAPPEPPTPDAKLTELVRLLGHKSFAVREAAGRDLVTAGMRAVPALTSGLKDADPQIAERCKQLLPLAAAHDRNKRLAQLLKDPAGSPPPIGLAGVERFLKITGDETATRQLYADMMASHYALVEALERDPDTASRLMGEFADKALERRLQPGRRVNNDAIFEDSAQVALFLFARSDRRFDDWPPGLDQASLLVSATRLKAAVTGPREVPGMRKLFLHWLDKEKLIWPMPQAFEIVGAAKMKEAMPAALRVMADEKQSEWGRVQAMLTLTRIGGKDNKNDLAPLLTDETQYLPSAARDGDEASVQFRDVALAVSVRLAGEKLSDYGFRAYATKADALTAELCWFSDAAAREKAHAKWKARVKSQEAPAKK